MAGFLLRAPLPEPAQQRPRGKARAPSAPRRASACAPTAATRGGALLRSPRLSGRRTPTCGESKTRGQPALPRARFGRAEQSSPTEGHPANPPRRAPGVQVSSSAGAGESEGGEGRKGRGEGRRSSPSPGQDGLPANSPRPGRGKKGRGRSSLWECLQLWRRAYCYYIMNLLICLEFKDLHFHQEVVSFISHSPTDGCPFSFQFLATTKRATKNIFAHDEYSKFFYLGRTYHMKSLHELLYPCHDEELGICSRGTKLSCES
ncbi:uncharacterized protein ACOB8E_004669 [Sarcophilus harrisii]